MNEQKVILITGATDGIGLLTASQLAKQGHRVLVHGRNPDKLAKVVKTLNQEHNTTLTAFIADLSVLSDVQRLIEQVSATLGETPLDVLINNAGIFNAPADKTPDGLDIRFAVNTVAPYLLTQGLLPLMPAHGRVVNLSSAAQASVSIDALQGKGHLSDREAYAQSKLAITMWSRALGEAHRRTGPMIVSVNPKSLLGSKMVKEAFGIAGGDLSLGADILVSASLDDAFSDAGGRYYDNDIEAFGQPHPDALDDRKVQAVIEAIEGIVER